MYSHHLPYLRSMYSYQYGIRIVRAHLVLLVTSESYPHCTSSCFLHQTTL
jgi:hypothetical protein